MAEAKEISAVIGMSADLSLIGVMIKSVRLPLTLMGVTIKFLRLPLSHGRGYFFVCFSVDGR